MELLWSAVWSHGIYTNGSGVVGNLVWLLEDTAIVMKHDCTLRINHYSIVHQMLTLKYAHVQKHCLCLQCESGRYYSMLATLHRTHHGTMEWTRGESVFITTIYMM